MKTNGLFENGEANGRVARSSWELGTNRFASQKGMSAFGSPRNVVTKVVSRQTTPQNSEGVIPKLAGASQNSGKFQPFGDSRDVVRKIEDHFEITPVKKADKETSTFLSRWATPNSNATNSDIGKPRKVALDIYGSGKRDRRCEAVLPRLQYANALPGTGAIFQGPRQVTTKIEGLDFSDDEQAKCNAILPWLTGPTSMQTQSGTGGFLKPRDVCNKTYYDSKRSV